MRIVTTGSVVRDEDRHEFRRRGHSTISPSGGAPNESGIHQSFEVVVDRAVRHVEALADLVDAFVRMRDDRGGDASASRLRK